jgi:hypothetical protein
LQNTLLPIQHPCNKEMQPPSQASTFTTKVRLQTANSEPCWPAELQNARMPCCCSITKRADHAMMQPHILYMVLHLQARWPAVNIVLLAKHSTPVARLPHYHNPRAAPADAALMCAHTAAAW